MSNLSIVFSNENEFLIDLNKLNILIKDRGLNHNSDSKISLHWIKRNFTWKEIKEVSTLVPDSSFNYEFDFKHAVVSV